MFKRLVRKLFARKFFPATANGLGLHHSNGGPHRTHINCGRDQNINHHRYQNINNGGLVGQVAGGEAIIAGRDLINDFFSTSVSPFECLVNLIAGVNASHKAELQRERGHCLPGTYVEAIGTIYDWMLDRESESPICWLSGAAGVGKSAIAMTVAQECENEGLLASSFFFFRSDPKRNNPSALIPTIAHDLASAMSYMRHYIEQKISKDPRILEANLEVQFHELIFEPVLLLQDRFIDQPGSPATPNLVVIDGLDECGDEAAQLRILSMIRSAYQQTLHFPLRFLICSRQESWLRESFKDEPLLHLSKSIVLDDSLAAQDDIRQYYQHHFDEIASCQKRNQVQFPTLWPSEADLQALVERTCGQFIFAATVIKFIKDMFKHPIEQLHIIIKRIPPCRPGASPYKQLDILYGYILSANPDYDKVCLILAVILVLPTQSMRTPVCIEWLLGLPAISKPSKVLQVL
ncbi:hypothetical protein PQX77_022340 [Marasmius sp. AFHP31]|nr:hypothetical protein PQX77_022340 [Marasmius sp. AFHP31]